MAIYLFIYFGSNFLYWGFIVVIIIVMMKQKTSKMTLNLKFRPSLQHFSAKQMFFFPFLTWHHVQLLFKAKFLAKIEESIYFIQE